MTEDETIQVVGGSALGFGAAGVLFPRLLARIFGVRADTGEFVYLMRLAGTGNIGLGINLLLARFEDRKRVLAIAAAVDALACFLALRAGSRRTLSKRTALLLAASTGSVAAVAAGPVLRPER